MGQIRLYGYYKYWCNILTRPSCEDRKCTCVNNRCIRSRNIRIWPWPWTGWMSAICDAHKKKVGVELLYNSVHRKFNQLEIRCGRENQQPERLGPRGPGWAAQENGKETLLWPLEWRGSICFSSVRSPTPSLSKTFSNPFEPFQIKWEVYFSKELCRSSLLCRRYDSACICVCIVGHGYATLVRNPWYNIAVKYLSQK